MTLITRNKAAKLRTEELHGLLKKTFNELSTAPRDSQQRRDALASLDAIERELAKRALPS